MDRLPRHEDGVLRALERSRSVALEEAQSLRHARSHELADSEAAHDAIARARELAYEVQRRQVTGAAVFSSEQLHWTCQYITDQLAREQAARNAREEARTLLEQAQQEVSRRLEEVRVVERLRARRLAEFLRTGSRRQQWRLDELGVIKAWSADLLTTGEDTWPSAE